MRAFICYSRKDMSFVNKLTKDLNARGVPTWRDVDNISRDVDAHTSGWRNAIDRGLRESTHMIVVLSPDSVESPECAAEWNYFMMNRKPVIPVLYRECEIPYRLYALEYWDMRDGYGEKIDDLAASLPDLQPGSQPLRRRKGIPRIAWIGGALALVVLLCIGTLFTLAQIGRNVTPTPPTDDVTENPTTPAPTEDTSGNDAATATAVMQQVILDVQDAVRNYDREVRHALETGDITGLSGVARGEALNDRLNAINILQQSGNCHWSYDHRSITIDEPTFDSTTQATITATIDRDGRVYCGSTEKPEYAFLGPVQAQYTVQYYSDDRKWLVTDYVKVTKE